MALMKRLKDAVGMGDQELTFNYNCRECDTRFETEQELLSEARCPNCGASGSRSLSRM